MSKRRPSPARCSGASASSRSRWIILFDGVSEEVTLISQVYRGHTMTPVGSLIGFLYGVVDGLRPFARQMLDQLGWSIVAS